MKAIRRLAPAAAFLFLYGCSQVPEETEKARGVLTGVNLVLALSVLFLVLAVGLVFLVVMIDRAARNRRRLADGPVEEPEEPEDEVVAGITVGRAPVPRWLYGAYVLIPLFAFAYVFANIRPAAAPPEPTEAPEVACTDDCEIEAEAISFTKETLLVVAEADITLTFNNTDAVVHDFTLWEGPEAAAGEQIVTTDNVPAGGSGTAEFKAPAVGETLPFNCTIHPAMTGEVEGAEAPAE